MNTAPNITCPHCGQPISLDDALTHQFEEKLRSSIMQENAEQLALRIKEAEASALRAAKEAFSQEQDGYVKKLRALEQDKAEKEQKLKDMADQELRLRQEKNRVEERERQLALEVQRQLDEQKQSLREAVEKEMAERTHFQTAQKDKVIDDLRKQLGEAQRVAQQGSQQSQGEVVELELENLLRRLCPLDVIEPVGKGITGADIVQTVCDRSGTRCGTIVWELKNTKAWSPGWISKLKEDQRRVKAEVAVLITAVLPDGIKEFGYSDGVWVGTFNCAAGLATVLRSGLLDVSGAKVQGENKQEKMEVLYQYLTGVSFSQRVQTVVEAFVELQNDLNKEKRAYTKMWESRSKQLERALLGMSGMWGDLEGLMGPALPKMEALSLEEGDPME